ncbi:MAG TPA: hypothetical protein VGF61_15625 [Candidatus Acidoferrum sp.]
MNQSFTSLNSLLFTIVLATLAIGLPILLVLSFRFLWDRRLSLGRSKELEKLIWQLHRIASAMEHQMNLAFPAVQPGTEEPRDLAYLQNPAPPTAVPPRVAPASVATASAANRPAVQRPPAPQPAVPQPAVQQSAVQQPGAPQPVVQQTSTPEPAAEEEALPALERRDPSVVAPRAGVNSMFGL